MRVPAASARVTAHPQPTNHVSANSAVAFGLSALLSLNALGPVPPALADGDTSKFKFPPIDNTNKNRCQFSSSAMGQANAARDSLYDLRQCSMAGTKAMGFDISGALLAGGDFSGVNFKEAQLSKVYAEGAKFDGADFTNVVIDRAFFKGASFKGAVFK